MPERNRTLSERSTCLAIGLAQAGNALIATVNLAEVYAASGRHEKALKLLDQVSLLDGRMVSQVFSVTSESQRMKLLEAIQIRDRVYLSLVFSHQCVRGGRPHAFERCCVERLGESTCGST